MAPSSSSITNDIQPDVIIVGAGIAGLTAGALLQKRGARVLILEHHDKVGGCAGWFQAGEFCFPTGATAILGLKEGDLHAEVFELLNWPSPPASHIEGLRVILPDRTIFWAHDARIWRNERRKLGGNLRGQTVFWKWQEMVADAGWEALRRHPSLPLNSLFDLKANLKLASPQLAPLAPAQFLTVGDVMRLLHIERDRAFRALVELGLIITSQNTPEATPFLNGAAGLDLWRHGAFHLQGGVGTLARSLGEAFVALGGDLRTCTTVYSLEKSKGQWHLQTSNGSFTAPLVAWNGGLESLQKAARLPEKAHRHVEKSVSRGGQQWGAVMLYCGVSEAVIPPDFGLHAQVLTDYSARSGDGRDVFLSLSAPGDLTQAPAGYRALNVSTHTHLEEWRKQSPLTYRAQKREWLEKLLEGVRRALPDFDEGKRFVITGTPRSWQHYTRREGGGVGGFPTNRNNANLRALSGRLGEGLWCIGDSVFPGQGTVAAALSGYNFAREVR